MAPVPLFIIRILCNGVVGDDSVVKCLGIKISILNLEVNANSINDIPVYRKPKKLSNNFSSLWSGLKSSIILLIGEVK